MGTENPERCKARDEVTLFWIEEKKKAVFYDYSFMFYYFASDILGKLMFVYLC